MKIKPKLTQNHDKLKTKTLKGFLWAFFDAVGYQGVQFIVMLILARILEPAEFGLIAMLTIFISLSQVFLDSGFATALIQKKNADYIDENSIFYFNILAGVITVFILWFLAPWIGSFYNEPELISLTRVLSITLFIDSFGIIHYTLLKRAIDFKKLAKVSLISSVLSGIIAISMAYNNFGVWSLVLYTICNKSFRLILYWLYSNWRPKLIFSFKSLYSMFNYGSNVLFISILETVFNNLYLIVIGKLFSPADLGYYSRAKSLQQIPVQNISGIVSRVTFPTFSKIQDDKTRLRRGLKKSVSTVALITLPMMIGLYILAKPVVLVLLTTKWLPSVPYLQLLCVIGLTYPLNIINLNVLKAIGRSGLLFRLELLKKIIIVFAIIITYQEGIEMMIIGQIIVYSFSYLWNLHYVGKSIDYKMSEQLKDISPIFILACIMGLGIYLLTFIQVENIFLLLLLQIVFGIIFYALLCYALKLSSFMEAYKIIKTKYFNFYNQ